MKVKSTLLSVALFGALAAVSVASFGKAYMSDRVQRVDQSVDTSFESFLDKFTTSAAFQYSRIKFPLESPIVLLDDNGNEKSYSFTKEKWPLLGADWFVVQRAQQEEGGVYIVQYAVDEPAHKEFEAGFEDGELDLRIVFNLIEDKWYVTDCYNAWYSFDLPNSELQDAVRQVKEENAVFEEQYP